jgi:hypothetical protein
MPALFHLFSQALPRIVHWARPILIEAGAELLARGHILVGNWAARCVSFSSPFALLMFFSSFARLDELMDEFRLAAIDGDWPRFKQIARRIVLQAGELVLLRFAAHLLEAGQSLMAA